MEFLNKIIFKEPLLHGLINNFWHTVVLSDMLRCNRLSNIMLKYVALSFCLFLHVVGKTDIDFCRVSNLIEDVELAINQVF